MTALPAEALRAAALGAEAGRHPLPPAVDPRSRWWRAVALGGQGRYASAAAELALLAVPRVPPGLRSLALSTRASHLRQLGGHALARRLDGAALVLAADVDGVLGATARCDALVGLAADAIGAGRVALARCVLVRVAGQLAAAEDRCTVRWHWVSAETALCSDDPHAARGHAATARLLADEGVSVRHQVKSLLVEAAATGSTQDAERARAAAAAHDLLPLRWAATMLLLALPGSPAGGGHARENTVSHAMLARRGGLLPGTPVHPDLAPLPLLVARAGRIHPAPGSPDRGQGGVRVVR